MYVVAGANRPIFNESNAYLYNLDDPTYSMYHYYHYQVDGW